MQRLLATAALAFLGGSLAAQSAADQPLPPVPVPTENPITAPKAVLGKILFWEEQLSSTDTVACGTCHRAEAGGADPRSIATNPGLDGLFGTPDDIEGSRGVQAMDSAKRFEVSDLFGLGVQVTGRASPSFISSQHSPEQFWDGRATSQFLDPQTGAVSIVSGGSLESQAVGPIVSSVEMAHAGRSWTDVIQKLQNAKPMALASNLTPDIVAALSTSPDYPSLFQAAFGDPAITAERIGFALATYERTLVPDQTPYDLWVAGDPNAMTPAQVNGLIAFRGAQCDICHSGGEFTDHTYRNIGIRPIAEDSGRQAVTGLFADRGKFRTPSLRNVGLKPTFMHDGSLTTLGEVIDFYRGTIPGFPENRDPSLPQVVPGIFRADVIDFMANALTDPRVAGGLPPFDRPTLRSELPGSVSYGTSLTGTGGVSPVLLASQPAFPGAQDFRIGLGDGIANSPAALTVGPNTSPVGPLWVDSATSALIWTMTDLDGVATVGLPIPKISSLSGVSLNFQGFVIDLGSPMLFSASTASTIVLD